MKILILHPDSNFRTHFANWIHCHSRHAATHDDMESIVASVACHEPNIVFLVGTCLDKDLFPNTGFYSIPDAIADFSDENQIVREFLDQAHCDQRSRVIESFGYSDDCRVVFHDPKFEDLAGARLHRAQKGAVWKIERDAIRGQLQAAVENKRHERAKDYLITLRNFDEGLQLEMSYRLSHGSYKISELREVVGRWVTVMAHYVGSVDIERCPAPQNASPEIGFVHYSMPTAFQYPILGVFGCGINPAIKICLIEAIEWAFAGEDDAEVAKIGCRLMGLSRYLAQVAEAQVMVIESLIDPISTLSQGGTLSRLAHRQLGIFCEFWGLNFLRESHDELAFLAQEFRQECEFPERSSIS